MTDIVERLRRINGWTDEPDASPIEAADEIERLRADKDQAYLERNHVVAALARLYPSGTRATNIPGWSPDWHGCVYIDLPSGQISYHYHASQAHLFADLPPYAKEWDGHDKDAVHTRLAVIETADEIERLRHEEMRLRTALDYHVNELREARRDIDRLRGAA